MRSIAVVSRYYACCLILVILRRYTSYILLILLACCALKQGKTVEREGGGGGGGAGAGARGGGRGGGEAANGETEVEESTARIMTWADALQADNALEQELLPDIAWEVGTRLAIWRKTTGRSCNLPSSPRRCHPPKCNRFTLDSRRNCVTLTWPQLGSGLAGVGSAKGMGEARTSPPVMPACAPWVLRQSSGTKTSEISLDLPDLACRTTLQYEPCTTPNMYNQHAKKEMTEELIQFASPPSNTGAWHVSLAAADSLSDSPWLSNIMNERSEWQRQADAGTYVDRKWRSLFRRYCRSSPAAVPAALTWRLLGSVKRDLL
jgi:hypothetical protein